MEKKSITREAIGRCLSAKTHSLLVLMIAVAFLWSGAAQSQETSPDDTRIHLEAAVFDPLQGPGPAPEALRLETESGTTSWLVQFRAPLTRQQRETLIKEYGLKLTLYIPNLAYLERIPEETVARLRQSNLVRAIVAYQPAYKISPRIGRLRFRGAERRNIPGLLLRAVLFDDADPGAVAESLKALQGVTIVSIEDLRQEGAPARIEFQLASRSQLPPVARLEGIRWIEEVAEQVEDNGISAGTIQSGTPGDEPVWDRGIHGEGQIIGVVDSGVIDMGHCMFRDPVNNVPGVNHRKVLGVRGASVSDHATFVAGIAAGDDFNNLGFGANRGNAWAARLVSGRRGEGAFNAFTANRAVGATIHTNSWHDDTGSPAIYNQTAADVDTFLWNNPDHLVFGSMGNNGEEQGPPGTAKDAVGVNAARRDPNEMFVGDGNPGPTADGRRKPDIVAPGCGITSAISGMACGVLTWPGSPNVCATSWATPATAATAALIRQYYREGWYPTGTARPQDVITPTGALLKATLLNATIDMTGVARYPSNNEGWGLARLENTLFFTGSPRHLSAWDRRNADGVATGEFQAFTVNVASATEPLKVTLVWSEPPGTAGAANPVVNDLDLTVTAPDSTTYVGNRFIGGQSAPGGTPDLTNNVEQVLINNPAIGTWTIRVRGRAASARPLRGSPSWPRPDRLPLRFRSPVASLSPQRASAIPRWQRCRSATWARRI
jgi:Subtilase family